MAEEDHGGEKDAGGTDTEEYDAAAVATDRRADTDGYDALAARADDLEGWASLWGSNPLQREYAWPVTRRFVPDPGGKHVLDAGCGIGDHVPWLLDAGAEVTGIDASERAVERARDRFGATEDVTVSRADLTTAVPLDDGAVEGVLILPAVTS